MSTRGGRTRKVVGSDASLCHVVRTKNKCFSLFFFPCLCVSTLLPLFLGDLSFTSVVVPWTLSSTGFQGPQESGVRVVLCGVSLGQEVRGGPCLVERTAEGRVGHTGCRRTSSDPSLPRRVVVDPRDLKKPEKVRGGYCHSQKTHGP